MPKITALPLANPPGVGDLLVLDQGQITKRIDFNVLQSAVANAGAVQGLLAGQTLSSGSLGATITAAIQAQTLQVAPTIASLKALSGAALTGQVFVLGYNTSGDSGGGLFFWNSADVTNDNGGTIFIPNVGGTGRWNRVFSGEIDFRWFGPKGDGTDDSTAWQNATTFAQIKGSGLYVPASGVRYLVNNDALYDVSKGPLSIRGDGPYSTVIRYGGTGKWLSGTGGNGSIQLYLRDFTLQMIGVGATGIDASQASNTVIRSVRIASSAGSGQTGILSRPTNNSNAPFFVTLDDIRLDSLDSGIVLDTTVGNAPNRWTLGTIRQLGGNNGIKIGTNSTQLVSGGDIGMFYCDQQTGVGLTFGANADRWTAAIARQETAAGGTLFSMDPSANRCEVTSVQVHAGTEGTSQLGQRPGLVGQTDEQIVWSAGLSLGDKIFSGAGTGVRQLNVGMYMGSGLPSNSFGNNMDFYLRGDGGLGSTVFVKRLGSWTVA